MTSTPSDAKPFFSVVIPVYNGVPYLDEALESVWAQTFRDWEIIVVDDQSKDGTKALVDAFVTRHPGVRLTYLYMREKPNVCPGRVRNFGIREAKGEWISFIDHDDRWEAAKLHSHHQAILAHPNAGLVHNDEIFFSDEGLLKGGAARIASRKDLEPSQLNGDCFDVQFFGNVFGLSCTSVKKSVFEAAGAFDETIAGTDDYELFLRLSARYQAAYVHQPLTFYRVHASNMSKNEIFMMENLVATLEKTRTQYPERMRKLGSAKVSERLHFLHISLAALYAKHKRMQEARRGYAAALKYKPASLGTWLRVLLPSRA